MSIEHAIWIVGDKPVALQSSKLTNEKLLEEMILSNSAILSPEWMVIGRQEVTAQGGKIDLLAIAPDGSLILVELKRDRTPREVVAQALDYASWVEALTTERILQIYQRFTKGGSLDAAFAARFGTDLDEDALNQSHQIVIVAAELDSSTERIVAYLNARDIAINVVMFRVFQHGSDQLLSRAWLIDPGETQANVATSANAKGKKEPWNGEFYVSYGPTESRSWADARKYGFVSAGGGLWYSQTLKMLNPGDRIWVKIPKTGYVGVGRVLDGVCRADDFIVKSGGGDVPILQLLENADGYKKREDDPYASGRPRLTAA